MLRFERHLRWLIPALLIGACGCARPESRPAGGDEGPNVRARFDEFREALRGPDVETLWSLLSKQSRDEAERAARTLREEYEKADAKSREQQEKEWGLPGAELAALTGEGFLKTRRFRAKHEEAREGKFDTVSARGDTATLYYFDEDGDREKLLFVREDGQWKLWLKMPPVPRAAPEAKEDKRP